MEAVKTLLTSSMELLLSIREKHNKTIISVNAPVLESSRDAVSRNMVVVPNEVQTEDMEMQVWMALGTAKDVPSNVSDDRTALSNGYVAITPLSTNLGNLNCPEIAHAESSIDRTLHQSGMPSILFFISLCCTSVLN